MPALKQVFEIRRIGVGDLSNVQKSQYYMDTINIALEVLENGNIIVALSS